MCLNNTLDLYSDYLIVNQGQSTSTALSELLEGEYSHDKITRALSKETLDSKHLWQVVKPHVKPINRAGGVLILDDTVEEKAYMAESDLICWHFDHVTNRSIKGINQLTALYENEDISLPIAYILILKKLWVYDKKKKKDKRVCAISKQEYFRDLIQQSIDNGLIISYILADKWYGCKDNFVFIESIGHHFIMPLKDNRKVALTKEDQLQEKYQSIESLVLEENQVLYVYLEDVEFPLLLTKQLFKDEDAEAVLYLVTNDLTADAQIMKTQYQRRWKVECFYKSIKSNLGYANSPTHTVRTQSNHLFLSMVAFVKMEILKKATKKNHFAMKKILTMNALKAAWQKFQIIKNDIEPISLLNQCA
jgi:DDE superfamily endonuclease